MVLRTRFCFVGSEFLQARHNMFLYLFGTSRDQMHFQTFLSTSKRVLTSEFSSKCLRNLYPDLQLYCPSTVKGQYKKSSIWLQGSGILRTSSASAGMNTPLIISSSHLPVLLSIRQSTVAFSIDSIIGEETNGGCFMGSQWCCHILIFFPLLTLNLAPIWITSLPFKIIFQA